MKLTLLLLLFLTFPACCLGQLAIAPSSMLSSYPAALNNYVMISEGMGGESPLAGITPIVKEVSAMCMSGGGGMHAHIQFDRPFSGRIYSLGFGNVHECIYYNGFYSKSVLFSIPLQGCGTRATHNTRQVIDMVENRVYVQMDKYTLTGADKKFAFVCELAPIPSSAVLVLGNEIRRHPIVPLNAPKDSSASSPAKAIQPALLFYGNRQWRIPPQNVNFRTTQNNNLRFPPASHGNSVAEFPTVIVPLEDPFDGPSAKNFGNKNNLEKEIQDLNIGLSQQNRDTGVATTPEDPFRGLVSTSSTTTTPSSWAIVPLFRVSMMQPGEPSSTRALFSPFTAPPSTTSTTTTASVGVGEVRREVVRMYASQQPPTTEVDKSIYLEIRRAGGGTNLANSSRVEGVVKIGEPITLVVHAKAASKDPDQFNIFVHSCYSSDGSEASHIQLIDHSGCSVHPQVLSSMQRHKQGEQEIVYYFSMKAFKFPVNNDVYFFCSVDISPDYNFPELCPNNTAIDNSPNKKVVRRELVPAKEFQEDATQEVVREIKVVSKNVSVQLEEVNDGPGGYVVVKGVPAIPPTLKTYPSKLVTSPDQQVEQSTTVVQLSIGLASIAAILVLIIFFVFGLERRRGKKSRRKELLEMITERISWYFRSN